MDAAAEIIRSHMEDDTENEPVRNPNKLDDGWIPVEERLPEVDEFVIVTDIHGNVSDNICYGYAEEYDSEPSFHRWDDEMWKCYKPNAVAWQPLPLPYQPKTITPDPEPSE